MIIACSDEKSFRWSRAKVRIDLDVDIVDVHKSDHSMDELDKIFFGTFIYDKYNIIV